MTRLQTYKRTNRQPIALPQRQEGIALVLFVIGLLVVVAMGGLALDISHAMLNKSRLQNTVDVAALAGATVLDETGSKDEAGKAAKAVFAANRSAAGQSEMTRKVSLDDVIIEYSATLDPFDSGSANPEYVRVRVESFAIEVWLLQVLQLQGQDFTDKSFRASAVAGPSPTLGNACGVVPLIICAVPGEPAPYYGYVPGQVKVLKGSSKSKNKECENDIGNGNFQLARLDSVPGGNEVRDNLAGGYEDCVQLGKTVDTQPGNAAGPVSQGLNTRFGDYKGGMNSTDFPPDIITQQQNQNERITYEEAECDPNDPDYQACLDAENTCEIAGEVTGSIKFRGETVNSSADLDFNAQIYESRKAASSYDNPPFPSGNGVAGRRNLPVVIADCNAGVNNGQSNMPIMGFGCFFLLQALPNGNGNANEIFGEFLEDCKAQGNVGQDPTDIPGPYIIQLYNDPDSGDS